eukprot:gene27990-31076_t
MKLLGGTGATGALGRFMIMRIDGRPYRSIWVEDGKVRVIDQRHLPHRLVIVPLPDLATAATALRDMWVRGAPLIGATAAYGMAIAARQDARDGALTEAAALLAATRPTAINLAWAL